MSRFVTLILRRWLVQMQPFRRFTEFSFVVFNVVEKNSISFVLQKLTDNKIQPRNNMNHVSQRTLDAQTELNP